MVERQLDVRHGPIILIADVTHLVRLLYSMVKEEFDGFI
jgi:hypothetical protein